MIFKQLAVAARKLLSSELRKPQRSETSLDGRRSHVSNQLADANKETERSKDRRNCALSMTALPQLVVETDFIIDHTVSYIMTAHALLASVCFV